MQPIANTPSRAQQVYTAIRDNIRDCILEPGRHLVQEELAAALGVSRQPVQQAMLLLKNDGLVVEHGGRGLYVAPLDPMLIARHYQIRTVMDQLAARLVAEHAANSPQFRTKLQKTGEAILEEGRRALDKGSAADAVRQDVRFHALLYDLSGNPLIAPTAEPHWNFLRRVMVAVLLHADRGAIVWSQHQDILDALVAGDVEEGHRLVTIHIEGAHKALTAALHEAVEKDGKTAALAETV